MPVFNGGKYLKEVIESVLIQTETDWELLIIDDGSTDSTRSIAESYKDPRIKYYARPHCGLVETLNFGLKEAKGEYIARLDADDIAEPERLKKQLEFIKNKDLVLCGTWATIIDTEGNELGIMNYPPVTAKEIRKYALLHNPFIHPSVMFCRKTIIEAGGYRSYKHAEDYELWTRIIYKYPVSNLPLPLIRYRIHDSQITKKVNLRMRISGVRVRAMALFRFIF